MTGDSGGWSRQHVGCGQRDNVELDHAGIEERALPACNQCASETAASVDLRNEYRHPSAMPPMSPSISSGAM